MRQRVVCSSLSTALPLATAIVGDGVRCSPFFCPDGFLWDKELPIPGSAGIIARADHILVHYVNAGAQYVQHFSFDESGTADQGTLPPSAQPSFEVQSVG
jgi:hypothetical protein